MQRRELFQPSFHQATSQTRFSCKQKNGPNIEPKIQHQENANAAAKIEVAESERSNKLLLKSKY